MFSEFSHQQPYIICSNRWVMVPAATVMDAEAEIKMDLKAVGTI